MTEEVMQEQEAIPAQTVAKAVSVPPDQTIIDHLSLKLLQQTEVTNALQQKIAELNRESAQQKQLLVQARKEKHDADLEVSRLSTEVENITQELFEQANIQVKEANEGAYNVKQMNDRLSQTIKEKDTTIEILQFELANLKSMISSLDSVPRTPNVNASTEALDTFSRKSSHVNIESSTFDAAMESRIPAAASFCSKMLAPFNEEVIYSPIYNQLRFDLPAFATFYNSIIGSSSPTSVSKFDIRITKFYTKLLEDLDDSLKLDKAPALQTLKMRWNRKSFLQELMDSTVTIEPLSAATEVWKSQTLQKYVPLSSQPGTPIIPPPAGHDSDAMPSLSRFSTNTTSSTSYDPSLFKNATSASHSTTNGSVQPLAVTAGCGLCGEKRRDMNFSRLHHIKIETPSTSVEDKVHRSDYPLCINCASKYRSVVELLKFIATINPIPYKKSSELDDYIRSKWARFVQLRAKVWFISDIGIWNEKDKFGLVYGWQNDWLTTKVEPSSAVLRVTETAQSSQTVAEMTPLQQGIDRSDDSPEEMLDTVRDDLNASSYAIQPAHDTNPVADISSNAARGGNGWNGWSGVIAKPKHEKSVNVGEIPLAKTVEHSSKVEPQDDGNPGTPAIEKIIPSESTSDNDSNSGDFEDAITEQVGNQPAPV